jgi:NAD+ synthase
LEAEIIQIIEWLRLKVREAKSQGLVLGVSGGIDSAVAAALAVRAFPEASLGLILPCHSSDEDVSDAHLVCDTLGIRKMELNLDEPHQSILRAATQGLSNLYDPAVLKQNARLTDANLRARLRMSTLYTVANSLQYLVVGTDNAAEVYTGYFTKYGDGGVDLLPLSQFTKRGVRELARVLGIPAKIIAKAPSAGLWAGQTDEAEMGVTYAQIDDFLEGKPVEREARERIEYLHRLSEHKRQMPPVYARSSRQGKP